MNPDKVWEYLKSKEKTSTMECGAVREAQLDDGTKIIDHHMYTLVGVQSKQITKDFVIIRNPHDGSKTIDVPLETFCKCFDSISKSKIRRKQ